MSDIVEKLKGPRTEQGGLWPHPNLHDEAADEILRLRAENEKYNEYMLTMTAERNRLSDALVFLRTENEKLRAIIRKYLEGSMREADIRAVAAEIRDIGIKHYSDCAVHNEPALPAGECNCGGYRETGDE